MFTFMFTCSSLGQTAFHVACYHGELSCLHVFLRIKYKLDEVDAFARSGIDLAVMKDHKKVLRYAEVFIPAMKCL